MRHCNICSSDGGTDVERATVRSNVRKFREEKFAVWRCANCGSIHAADEVDLDHYYRHYPIHDLKQTKVDWMLRAMYRNQTRRLMRAGLQKEHHILDHGCGSGFLVDYLRNAGYPNAAGFDQYSQEFCDRRVLERTYDVVISQDVIEHVPEPWDLLNTLQGLSKPGAVIAIGTPNAEAIDLSRPEDRVHTLHQPYHRHIFSRAALLNAGEKMGWKLLRYYPTMYTNTLVPFVNTGFVTHYFSCHDDTLDLALEPIRMNSWRLWTPKTLFLALFGAFTAPETDVMAVFQRPDGDG